MIFLYGLVENFILAKIREKSLGSSAGLGIFRFCLFHLKFSEKRINYATDQKFFGQETKKKMSKKNFKTSWFLKKSQENRGTSETLPKLNFLQVHIKKINFLNTKICIVPKLIKELD